MRGMDHKRAQRDFWGNRYVHYLECGDGFTGVRTYHISHLKYV